MLGLFFLSPTSLKQEFHGLPSGFTRWIMKIKYACRDPNFKVDTNFKYKNMQVAGKG